MTEIHRPSIAVLASGEGETFEAFVHASQQDIAEVDVALVITDKPNAGVLKKVADLNARYGLAMETEVINSRTHPGGKQESGQTLEESAAICNAVNNHNVSLIALMGYMRIIAAEGDLMQQYGWLPEYADNTEQNGMFKSRLLNTHPGKLPETANTYNIYTHQRVLELGLTSTAHTVHVVSAKVDEGPIFAEHPVPVFEDDDPHTLSKRVRRVEQAYLPIDIDSFLKQSMSSEQ